MIGGGECEEAALQFFYDPEENEFYDESGWIEHRIFDFITPTDLKLFLEDGSYRLCLSKMGYYVELFWPENCYL